MGTLLNRRRYMGGAKGLPYDAEVEYLESTGTQYIELPFGFAKTDEVYTVFSVDTSQVKDKYMVAPKQWNDNSNRFAMGVHNTANHAGGKFTIAYGAQATSGTMFGLYNDGKIHTWSYGNYSFSVVDLNLERDVRTITFGSETKNLKLFYGYNSNTIGKMRSYKHVKDGVVVIDLIAVRVGTTGYMYDKVSGTLLGNSGTGDFILGPDKT